MGQSFATEFSEKDLKVSVDSVTKPTKFGTPKTNRMLRKAVIVRIISARAATRQEIKDYEENAHNQTP
jgi:hypothetical protein